MYETWGLLGFSEGLTLKGQVLKDAKEEEVRGSLEEDGIRGKDEDKEVGSREQDGTEVELETKKLRGKGKTVLEARNMMIQKSPSLSLKCLNLD